MSATTARLHRRSRRPQLERETPLVALAAARTVVEEASRLIGTPLPERFAARIAHQARRVYAHSPQFRRKLQGRGDTGRDWLYAFLYHWLAARLHADRCDLFVRLPRGFATGEPPAGRILRKAVSA